MVGFKVRSCKPLRTTAWYVTPKGDRSLNVSFRRRSIGGTAEDPKEVSKSDNIHDFGWWDLEPKPQGGFFYTSIKYRCNPFYTQTVQFGPFTYDNFFKHKARNKNKKQIDKIIHDGIPDHFWRR